MTQIAKPGPSDVTLETRDRGAGFRVRSCPAWSKRPIPIEIVEPLGRAVGKYSRRSATRTSIPASAMGTDGWPEVQGGFDIIIVTCAAQGTCCPTCSSEMKPGGRLIIPIGQPFKRGQVLDVYTKDTGGQVSIRSRDMGVFFIPMTGAMMKTPAPAGSPVSSSAPARPAVTPGAAPAREKGAE